MRLAALAALAVAALLAGCGKDKPKDPLTRDAERFFADDASRPVAARVKPLPAQGDQETLSVSYVGARGQRVPAVFTALAAAQSIPCVVFLHGLAGSKADAKGILAPMRQLGIGVFAYDAPLQGERDNGTLEQVVRDPKRLADLFKQNVVDARRALDVLTDFPECDATRLGVVGLSFGGLTGLLTAAVDKRVRSTVTLSVAGGGKALLVKQGQILPGGEASDPDAVAAALKALAPLDPTRWVKRISPRALLLVNGRKDPDNPPSLVAPLRAAAGPGTQTYAYDGGHNPFVGPTAPAFLKRLKDFERTTLLQGP